MIFMLFNKTWRLLMSKAEMKREKEKKTEKQKKKTTFLSFRRYDV